MKADCGQNQNIRSLARSEYRYFDLCISRIS